LTHWSDPKMALVTNRKEVCGRLTESPYVFRHAGAYYLSATGIGGGYRGTVVWRSVNPRRFDADQVVARIDSHAPEWVHVDAEEKGDILLFKKSRMSPFSPNFVTHCGWKQGGVYLAPVRWETEAWWPFGLLVLRQGATKADLVEVSIRCRDTDKVPYRTWRVDKWPTAYALPPGRYRVAAQAGGGKAMAPVSIEIVADERTYLDVP